MDDKGWKDKVGMFGFLKKERAARVEAQAQNTSSDLPPLPPMPDVNSDDSNTESTFGDLPPITGNENTNNQFGMQEQTMPLPDLPGMPPPLPGMEQSEGINHLPSITNRNTEVPEEHKLPELPPLKHDILDIPPLPEPAREVNEPVNIQETTLADTANNTIKEQEMTMPAPTQEMDVTKPEIQQPIPKEQPKRPYPKLFPDTYTDEHINTQKTASNEPQAFSKMNSNQTPDLNHIPDLDSDHINQKKINSITDWDQTEGKIPDKPSSEWEINTANLERDFNMPLFVRADKYSEVIDGIDDAKKNLRDAEEVLFRTKETEEHMNKEYDKWHAYIEDIQRKLIQIDEQLFEQ